MSTPTEIINDARQYAGNLVTTADQALANAIHSVENIGFTGLSYNPTPLALPPLTLLGLTAPTLASVSLTLPGEPNNTLLFQDVSAFDAGSAPEFNATAPTLSLPNTPSQLAAFTASLPSIDLSAQFPDAPDLILPESPIVQDRTEPTAPTTLIPAFGGIMPVNTSIAPTDLEGDFSGAYHAAAPEFIAMIDGYVDAELAKINPEYHQQMARIEAQLATYLAGGTGLSPAVENAIYTRARSKNDAESRRVIAASYADSAARGFTLPPGALFSAAQQARQAGADNNAAGAREIVVMQAEMEQKNLQFAVTTSAGLRVSVLNATLSYMQNLGQLNGQALEYAKGLLGAIIEVYNLAVKAFSIKLEGYKTEAAVFETLMRAALAGIDIYKAEIAALEALTQVDRTKVEVYRARIDSLTAISNMYRTQVDAVVSKASLEKLKIDVFQAQVQARQAEVQGKNAEWQGYTAAIEGQVAQVKVFGEQANAYGHRVLGYKATVEAKSEVIKAAAIGNEARAKQFAAVMSGYQTVVQTRGEVARIQLENQRQAVNTFQVQAEVAVANAKTQLGYYQAVTQVGIENAKLGISAIVQSADLKRGYSASLAQIHTANANIHGHLAGAAMSGMNSLAASTETI